MLIMQWVGFVPYLGVHALWRLPLSSNMARVMHDKLTGQGQRSSGKLGASSTEGE